METEQFTEEEFVQVMEWVTLTQSMLGIGPEFFREMLKDAVQEIAGKCNARWPLGKGEQFPIGQDDLDADFSPFGDEVSVRWIGMTALCIFAGMDGPNLTADVLCDGIDELTDDIEARADG